MKFQPDSLYCGDCLDIMRAWPDGCIDLCYLDPPFNSKTDYNILFGQDRARTNGGKFAQFVAFEDTWMWDDAAQDRVDSIERAVAHPAHKIVKGLRYAIGDCGMLAYLSYMAERLVEIRRVLKPTGSVYLHCDPTASHYLKAALDGVFGAKCFLNEVSWRRTTTKGDYRQGALNWPRVRDVLLHYASDPRGGGRMFRQPFTEYDPAYIKSHYSMVEPDTGRRYRLDNLTAPGAGSRGHPKYELMGVERHWRYNAEKMADLIAAGRVVQTAPGRVPAYKRYLDEMPGVAVGDDWSDIKPINSQAKERLGYPTQKPEALLRRVIEASSNEGDIVLDPFAGCGTTVVAARNLKRRFVGIDISHFAIDIVRERRLQDKSIPINGFPVDLPSAEMLAREVPFEFEKWAITRIPGMVPNAVQIGDGGIDGRGIIHGDGSLVLAQVKGGRSFQLGHVRDFRHVLTREQAACGVFTTLRPVTSPKAKAEAKGAGYLKFGANRYPAAQLWSIQDYFQERLPMLPPLADPYTGKAMQLDMLAH
ncbi:site-specific DNA-methyltransferase [Candidatus Foliamicus sp.]